LGEIIFARGELDAIIIALPFVEHGIVAPPLYDETFSQNESNRLDQYSGSRLSTELCKTLQIDNQWKQKRLSIIALPC